MNEVPVTYKEDIQKDIESILRGIIEDNLEFSFSLLQGGYFYPGEISFTDSEIKNLFETLKKDPFLSEIKNIRKLSDDRLQSKRISQLAQALLKENIFPSFTSKEIHLNFDVEFENEAKLETVPIRYRSGSTSISSSSIMKVESLGGPAKVGSSSMSCTSNVSGKGEVS